jgi:hypothetical protein
METTIGYREGSTHQDNLLVMGKIDTNMFIIGRRHNQNGPKRCGPQSGVSTDAPLWQNSCHN